MQLSCMEISEEATIRVQICNTGVYTDEASDTIFLGLIYKEFIFFTEADVYQFLIWLPKLHAP